MNLRNRGNAFAKILGAEMHGAIKAKGLTIKRACERSGIHEQTVYRYLNGSRPMPSDVLAALCEAIKMEPQELINRAYVRLLKEKGAPEDEES